MNNNYSVQKMSDELLDEIKNALESVKNFGSVEIYIQKGFVTQITVRKIRKVSSKPSNGKSLS
jgi:hypothetical protein